MRAETVITIDPARLAPGQWSHRLNKTVGEGDIHASYSGDRIGMGQPIRKPFEWRCSLWVCVGNRTLGPDRVETEVYRLVLPSLFDGEPTTYAEKTCKGEAARSDPDGFYHAMTVSHGGQSFILCGPPVTLVPGETAQLSLF